MKRKAVLIGSSPVEDPCFKVDSDVNLIKDLLFSKWGGAWLENEVNTVKVPTHKNICENIQWAEDADYTVIYFAGHGEIRKGSKPWKETHVLSHDMEFLPESQLNPGTPWCLQIFDCCRGDKTKVLLEKYGRAQLHHKMSDFELKVARIRYELKITECEKGLCRLYSASEDQSAATKPYTFTELMHKGIVDWVDSGTKNEISLNNILKHMDLSSLKMHGQQPEYNGGRRLHHFPLAISV